MEKEFTESLPKRASNEMTQQSYAEKPRLFALIVNYPNPFNPKTTVKYATPKQGPVMIEVYNVPGQRIKCLLDNVVPAGYHTIVWDGRSDAGQKVGAGIYFCRMQSGEFVKTMKMTMLP